MPRRWAEHVASTRERENSHNTGQWTHPLGRAIKVVAFLRTQETVAVTAAAVAAAEDDCDHTAAAASIATAPLSESHQKPQLWEINRWLAARSIQNEVGCLHVDSKTGYCRQRNFMRLATKRMRPNEQCHTRSRRCTIMSATFRDFFFHFSICPRLTVDIL